MLRNGRKKKEKLVLVSRTWTDGRERWNFRASALKGERPSKANFYVEEIFAGSDRGEKKRRRRMRVVGPSPKGFVTSFFLFCLQRAAFSTSLGRLFVRRRWLARRPLFCPRNNGWRVMPCGTNNGNDYYDGRLCLYSLLFAAKKGSDSWLLTLSFLPTSDDCCCHLPSPGFVGFYSRFDGCCCFLFVGFQKNDNIRSEGSAPFCRQRRVFREEFSRSPAFATTTCLFH